MNLDDYFDDDSDDSDDINFNGEEKAFLNEIYGFSSKQAKNEINYTKFSNLAKNITDEHKRFNFYQTTYDSPLQNNKLVIGFLKKEFYRLAYHFEEKLDYEAAAHAYMQCANLYRPVSAKHKKSLQKLIDLSDDQKLDRDTLLEVAQFIITRSDNDHRIDEFSELWLETYQSIDDDYERSEKRNELLSDSGPYADSIITLLSDDLKKFIRSKPFDETDFQTIRNLLDFIEPGSQTEAEWYTRFPVYYSKLFTQQKQHTSYSSFLDEISGQINSESYLDMVSRIYTNLNTEHLIHLDITQSDQDVKDDLQLQINTILYQGDAARLESLKQHNRLANQKVEDGDTVGESFHALVINRTLESWSWPEFPENDPSPVLFKNALTNRIDIISSLLKQASPEAEAVPLFIKNKIHLYESLLQHVSFDTKISDPNAEIANILKHNFDQETAFTNNNRNFLGWEN
jgi:hypothetical protein